MTSHACRRRALALLLGAAVSLTRAQSKPSRPPGAEPSRQDNRDPGLLRLEASVQQQIAQRKGASPLPWRACFITPDAGRLVWRPRSAAGPGGGTYRVALDPQTRWYFVARGESGGGAIQFFGPLEETGKGVFVDALAVASESPGGQDKPAKAKPKPKPKPPVKA